MHRRTPSAHLLAVGLIGVLLVQHIPVPVHVGGPCPVEDCSCEEGICQCDHWMQRQSDRRTEDVAHPSIFPCRDHGASSAIVLILDHSLVPSTEADLSAPGTPPLTAPAAAILRTCVLAPGLCFGQQNVQSREVRGARIYANTCGRCHNARSPVEFSDRDWRTIVMHMRTRTHLTHRQARAVEAFLRASNRNKRSGGRAEAKHSHLRRDGVPTLPDSADGFSPIPPRGFEKLTRGLGSLDAD